MDRSVLMALVIVFLFAMLGLLAVGWRSRRRRQRTLTTPPTPPVDLGSPWGTAIGKYVATTTAADPYDRIAAHGLGFRGAVSVTATESGLLVQRVGERDLWIPREAMIGARRGTWTIDRVVEPDGLNVIRWVLGDTLLDTYFRMDDPVACDAVFDQLVPIERPAL